MSNQLTIPAAFQNAQALAALDPNWDTKSDFSAGIRRGFAVLSIRGKVWRVVHQGESRPVTAPGTNHPAPSIDVVLVAATPGLSKVYYQGAYVEGSDDAPACFSHDGVRPDSSIQGPQASSCALCPHNVWGSKITENGKQTKACADSKRLAILPAGHESLPEDAKVAMLVNEMFGGPMLFRVPAASMSDLAGFDGAMGQMGFKLHAMVTRMSFDIDMAYPKIKFEPVRPLTVGEFQKILEWRESQQVQDMLVSPESTAAQPQAAQLPQQAAPEQVAQTYAQPVQAPVQQPVQAPVQNEAEAPRRGRGRKATEQPAAAAPAGGMSFGAPVQAPAQAPVQASPQQVPLTVAATPAAPTPAAQPSAAQDVDDLLDQLLG
jgi:hypothetical protein